MDQILTYITNINNITINGSNASITIPKADLLVYIQSLENISNSNIAKYLNAQNSIDTQSAVYDSQIANENTNISKDQALITLLS